MLDKQPKLRRLLWALCALAIAWFAIVFAYGFASFPQAPYKPCGTDAYCDKAGQRHSIAEFESLSRWEHVFKLSWPFGLLAGAIVWGLRRNNK